MGYTNIKKIFNLKFLKTGNETSKDGVSSSYFMQGSTIFFFDAPSGSVQDMIGAIEKEKAKEVYVLLGDISLEKIGGLNSLAKYWYNFTYSTVNVLVPTFLMQKVELCILPIIRESYVNVEEIKFRGKEFGKMVITPLDMSMYRQITDLSTGYRVSLNGVSIGYIPRLAECPTDMFKFLNNGLLDYLYMESEVIKDRNSELVYIKEIHDAVPSDDYRKIYIHGTRTKTDVVKGEIARYQRAGFQFAEIGGLK